MSIASAINFLKRVQVDEEFRKECYMCKSKDELRQTLEKEGYKFTMLEFDNGVNTLILRCADASQAFEIHHLQSWYNLVLVNLP